MGIQFKIKQVLYIGRSKEVENAIRELCIAHDLASSDIVITLADGENETIENQFLGFRSDIESIADLLSRTEPRGQIIFSVSIKAYEYIPEISLPMDLVGALGRLGASLDVDVISMMESVSGASA